MIGFRQTRIASEKADTHAALSVFHNREQQRVRVVMKKKCRYCGEVKPLSEFNNRECCPGGKAVFCRECAKECREHERTKFGPEYFVWLGMRARCKPNARQAHIYHDRGISVCPEWDSHKCFINDMGPRPTPQHQIDRIDNAKGYSPSNCRWATPAENSQNGRRTKLTPAAVRLIRRRRQEGRCQAEIAAETGVSQSNVSCVLIGQTWRNV